jgi:LmbE family N-acetylglucosaminyl deacetylase
MTKVLMLASFGLEIVECGGALAAHVAAGDEVQAAVLMARSESRDQIAQAAKILGIDQVDFLGFPSGEYTTDAPWKEKVVTLMRRVRPDIVITQDPVHAQHDLDPDRRTIALLYPESFALAGRDWHVEECGGYEPHMVHTIYYMTPEEPNCIVEISEFFHLKQKALEVLTYQLAFSAQSIQQRASVDVLRYVVPEYESMKADPVALGLEFHTQFDKALALQHGLAGHSGAVLGEAYRREGPFVIDRLLV